MTTDADATTEMLAILERHGLTPLEEDLPLLKINYEQALEQTAIVHAVVQARYEEPLLVAKAATEQHPAPHYRGGSTPDA